MGADQSHQGHPAAGASADADGAFPFAHYAQFAEADDTDGPVEHVIGRGVEVSATTVNLVIAEEAVIHFGSVDVAYIFKSVELHPEEGHIAALFCTEDTKISHPSLVGSIRRLPDDELVRVAMQVAHAVEPAIDEPSEAPTSPSRKFLDDPSYIDPAQKARSKKLDVGRDTLEPPSGNTLPNSPKTRSAMEYADQYEIGSYSDSSDSEQTIHATQVASVVEALTAQEGVMVSGSEVALSVGPIVVVRKSAMVGVAIAGALVVKDGSVPLAVVFDKLEIGRKGHVGVAYVSKGTVVAGSIRRTHIVEVDRKALLDLAKQLYV